MPTQTIKASDGSGSFSAYVAYPEKENAPAIIMIQEIFGVNEEMRKKCDNWAQQGYIAICPDLFWRQEPNVQITDQTEAEWAKAFSLYKGFDHGKGVEDLKETLEYIRQDTQCNGKVANIGYCLGGNLSYQMACKTDIDASVSFHGVGIEDLIGEAVNIQKPVLMHNAEEDEFVSKEAQAKIMAGLGPHEFITIHNYKGVNHAFSRLGGQHYDAEAANLANERTATFIKETIG